MSKTKVIIITRASEFLDSNGQSIQDRSFYGNPIQKELEDDNGFSKDKINLKFFLAAMDFVNKQKGKHSKQSWSTFFDERFGIIENESKEPLFTLEEYDIKQSGINQLISSKPEEVPIDNELLKKRCYVHFDVLDYDIILLLWDVLKRDASERVEPFGLFIEKLCEDCDVHPSELNILYIHDYQLLGYDNDATVCNDYNPGYISVFKNEPYYNTLKKYFKYVATFGHNTDEGKTFQNNILTFRFGPTLADKIAAKESNAESFQSLREMADELYNNHETNP